MTYRSIMVHAESGPACDRRLATALDVADMFDARLIGVGAVAVAPIVSGAYAAGDGEVVTAVLERVEADLPVARHRFQALVAAAKRSSLWIAEEDYPEKVLTLHSRAADLLVASRPDPKDGTAYAARPARLVMEAGGPVLLVNDAGSGLSGETVVVAWKDCREARRALTDALPFLRRAKKILFVHARERGGSAGEQDFGDIVKRLAAHSVNAAIETLGVGRASPARSIETAATRHGADLIVAGAFGRPRLAEWVLGGVTQDFMEFSSKFILFSH